MSVTAQGALEKYRFFRDGVLERDHHKCQICFTSSKLTAHHIKPRPEGSDELRNGITLCYKCHDVAESWPWESFWELMQEKRMEYSRQSSDGRHLIWGRDKHGVFSIEVDPPRKKFRGFHEQA